MIEGLIQTFLPIVIYILEIMGTLVIFFAAIKAFYRYVKMSLKISENILDSHIKIDLANSMALSLEFKLGGEILKTVLVRSLDEMYILAAIMGLRVILTFVIHWEIKNETEISRYEMEASASKDKSDM